jgi:hypothetical protein
LPLDDAAGNFFFIFFSKRLQQEPDFYYQAGALASSDKPFSCHGRGYSVQCLHPLPLMNERVRASADWSSPVYQNLVSERITDQWNTQ